METQTILITPGTLFGCPAVIIDLLGVGVTDVVLTTNEDPEEKAVQIAEAIKAHYPQHTYIVGAKI